MAAKLAAQWLVRNTHKERDGLVSKLYILPLVRKKDRYWQGDLFLMERVSKARAEDLGSEGPDLI